MGKLGISDGILNVKINGPGSDNFLPLNLEIEYIKVIGCVLEQTQGVLWIAVLRFTERLKNDPPPVPRNKKTPQNTDSTTFKHFLN